MASFILPDISNSGIVGSGMSSFVVVPSIANGKRDREIHLRSAGESPSAAADAVLVSRHQVRVHFDSVKNTIQEFGSHPRPLNRSFLRFVDEI